MTDEPQSPPLETVPDVVIDDDANKNVLQDADGAAHTENIKIKVEVSKLIGVFDPSCGARSPLTVRGVTVAAVRAAVHAVVHVCVCLLYVCASAAAASARLLQFTRRRPRPGLRPRDCRMDYYLPVLARSGSGSHGIEVYVCILGETFWSPTYPQRLPLRGLGTLRCEVCLEGYPRVG